MEIAQEVVKKTGEFHKSGTRMYSVSGSYYVSGTYDRLFGEYLLLSSSSLSLSIIIMLEAGPCGNKERVRGNQTGDQLQPPFCSLRNRVATASLLQTRESSCCRPTRRTSSSSSDAFLVVDLLNSS